MVKIIVIAEGQSEEIFIKNVIAPELKKLSIFAKPILIQTSRDCSGGAITFDRFKVNARNNLRQYDDAYITTFLDLYGLDGNFPGFSSWNVSGDLYAKVRNLESQLHSTIVSFTGCRPDRFIPHIQPHEFEALLFSDVEKLVTLESSWSTSLRQLNKICVDFENPEYINNSYETKPSKRLIECLRPKYKKTLHSPRGISHISLEIVEGRCPHFSAWMNSLRALAK